MPKGAGRGFHLREPEMPGSGDDRVWGRPMSVILLVRHGQASFGELDYDVLSPRGFRQAEVVGASLTARGVRVDRAVSGSLVRQRDTARTVLAAANAGVEVEVDPRWDEYDHTPVYDAFAASVAPELLADRAEAARGFQERLEVALLGWSGGARGTGLRPEWSQFSADVAAATDAVVDGLGSGATVLVITSGGVISAVCARLLVLPPAAVVAFNRVTVNAGITKVVHGRRGNTLVSFNDHAHFEGLHAELLTYR